MTTLCQGATVRVDLSRTEVAIARFIGRQRNKLSSETKINTRCDPGQTDEEMNIEAAGAELAVARYLNLYPDLSPTAGDLPDHDLHWKERRIDVKRNHMADGDLLVRKLNQEVIYVLTCGSLPSYSIIGWLRGYDIPLNGEWVDLPYGPCWRVRPRSLNRFPVKGGERCVSRKQ